MPHDIKNAKDEPFFFFAGCVPMAHWHWNSVKQLGIFHLETLLFEKTSYFSLKNMFLKHQ